MSERDALKRKIDKLSSMGVRFASRMLDALVSPPPAALPATESTWLTADPEWIEYFSLTIAAHHGHTTEPLGLTSFEVAFRNACGAVGWVLDPPGSPTQRFVDVTVRTSHDKTRKLSLKSTAAQRLSATSVHISKLKFSRPSTKCRSHRSTATVPPLTAHMTA